MKRQVEYRWRLAELMAARGLHNTTDLIPLLAERGIVLSRPQVYRLVNQKPERAGMSCASAGVALRASASAAPSRVEPNDQFILSSGAWVWL